ncbi:MAG: methylenetetrahydrofolate reductase [NAD(P)H] [Candidatus Omnitrophica bacterium]|jgi:methylenetetrahydrofolate reductase (NADPH)|nr:methylenetetrahydrofolate reductase [NAD(P)H] [Candidatus Omnitrophota bacterium]
MKISNILKQNKQGVSFEFFPPKNSASQESLITSIRILKKYNPLYVSMTCGATGAIQSNTQGAIRLLLAENGLVVMPHLTCIDLKMNELRKLLDEYKAKGIENIMALRGDPPQDKIDFDFHKQEFFCARELVKKIKEYTDFCVGVAVYPEGHIECASLEQDLEYTKQKIDSGADFAVTQMFFDNSFYFSLCERFRKKRINIPVLPGILPLTNLNRVRKFASICRATVPKHIEEKWNHFLGKPEEQKKVGIDFTIKQCQDLIKNGVKKLHFFTLNDPYVMQTILEAIKIQG